MKRIVFILYVISFFLIGCGSGTVDTPLGIVGTIAEAPAAKCPTGGVTLEQGIDKNADGVLDPEEVGSTYHICNGLNGADADVTALQAEVDELKAIVAANTAKTGITTEQATAISANTAKVGITTDQAGAITASTTTLSTIGSNAAFDQWDKNAADDFDGAHASLTDSPTTISISQAALLVDVESNLATVARDIYTNYDEVDFDWETTRTANYVQPSDTDDWDKVVGDDFDGEYGSLSNSPTTITSAQATDITASTATLATIGTNAAFATWDKNVSDDFDANYTSLSGVPDVVENYPDLVALSQYLGVDTAEHAITLSGANLRVHDGTGSTQCAATCNGLGNLTVGYNEKEIDDINAGSHNIIVGRSNSYTVDAYGGLLVGMDNSITAPYASVSGGTHNSATEIYSSVSGGWVNTASGNSASVSGGHSNQATGDYASIGGGQINIAEGDYSAVNGGWKNTTSGPWAACNGGLEHTVSGQWAAVNGGWKNIATHDFATVNGGYENTASNDGATVSGGNENTAAHHYSTVSGGYDRSSITEYDAVIGPYVYDD